MQEIAKNWKDYECIDAGNGYKLERWKDVILSRPESHANWSKNPQVRDWKEVHAYALAEKSCQE